MTGDILVAHLLEARVLRRKDRMKTLGRVGRKYGRGDGGGVGAAEREHREVSIVCG